MRVAGRRQPVDHEVRSKAARDLGTTYLVEAGAGTGKTRLLVGRYVSALLSGVAVAEIAAITFTEKAAGELRQKIRERLELLIAHDAEALAEAGLDEHAELGQEALRHLDAALADLDCGVISTIHAFAARLLRERPVEARIDPAFRQLDEIGADLALSEAWGVWLQECADPAPGDVPGRGQLAEALAAGVPLEEVRRVSAAALGRRYHVAPAPPPVAPDLAGAVADLRRQASLLAELARSCTDPGDRLCLALASLAEDLWALPEEGSCHELGCAMTAVATGGRGDLGQKGNWPGGKDEAAAARAAAAAQLQDAAARYHDYVAAVVLAAASGFVAYSAGVRQAAGVLDFDDLLGRARDLVAGDALDDPGRRSVRSFFQRRFRYLLVDEFQDTDPLQVELVMFLAEKEPEARCWDEVDLEPGKLFLVGDPKQSIYRFRKADIAIYQAVKEVIRRQGEVVRITQSFRAVPGLIDWFNQSFAEVIGDSASELQPRYEDVADWRPATQDGAAVSVLRVEADPDAKLDAVRRAEAAAVAALVAALPETGWMVADRTRAEGARAAGQGDVAILFRTLTSLETYERALREAGIAFRVDGGKSFFKRAEVVDTLAALHAIDVPGDALGVYAALHGCLFGFADDQLLAYRRAGGRFDLFSERPDGYPDVAEALDLLREVHADVGRRSIAAVVERLIEKTRLLELLAAERGATQARANVRQLVDLAAALVDRQGACFHEYVAQLRELQARDEGESGGGEEGVAVRLMTVHKAKGLEFPVVVLADPCGEGRTVSADSVLVSRSTGATAGLVAGVRLDPPGGELPKAIVCLSRHHEAVRAYENDAAGFEGRRLLYVACTRATERLIVPLRLDGGTPVKARPSSFAALLAPHVAAGVPQAEAQGQRLVEVVDAPPPVAPSRPPGPAACAADLLESRRMWLTRRHAGLATASRPAAVASPSGLELLDDDVDERVSGVARSTALGLGGVVHATLQQGALGDEHGLRALATALAADAGLAGEAGTAHELALACWRSAPVREAAAAGRCWRELPMAAVVDGVLIEGTADLVYERDGGLVLVDYKTDRGVDAQTVRGRYELQIGAYALALEAAAGATLLEALLVLPAAVPAGEPAAVVAVALDGALRDRVRASLRQV